MSPEKFSLIESLLEELMSLQAKYEEALKKDAVLSEKKELRIQIRNVQEQISELKKESFQEN